MIIIIENVLGELSLKRKSTWYMYFSVLYHLQELHPTGNIYIE